MLSTAPDLGNNWKFDDYETVEGQLLMAEVV